VLNQKRIVIVLVAAIMLTFAANSVNETYVSRKWISQSLGWTPVGHGFYQMALNSKGVLQLAYLGVYSWYYALMYGQMVDGNWNLTPVSRVLGDFEGASLALDSHDNVYLCTHTYHSVYGYTLYPEILFAACKDGTWTGSIINMTGYCLSAEVAVDENDTVHLFYTDQIYPEDGGFSGAYSRLIDMVSTQQGWKVEVLKNVSGDQYLWIDDLVRGPNGTQYILYTWSTGWQSGVEVEHLNLSEYRAGIVSDSEILVSHYQLAGGPALCVDGAGNAYVSYYWHNGSSYRICYSTDILGKWTQSDVAYGGNSWPAGTAIAVDSRNKVHVAYYVEDYDGSHANHSVRYCTNRSGSWNVKVVDNCEGWTTDEYVALLSDARGGIHMTYFQRNVGDHGDIDLTIYTTDVWGVRDYSRVMNESGLKAFLVCVVVGIVLYSGWSYEERKARPKPPKTGMAG
jgi:hypothetical protein